MLLAACRQLAFASHHRGRGRSVDPRGYRRLGTRWVAIDPYLAWCGQFDGLSVVVDAEYGAGRCGWKDSEPFLRVTAIFGDCAACRTTEILVPATRLIAAFEKLLDRACRSGSSAIVGALKCVRWHAHAGSIAVVVLRGGSRHLRWADRRMTARWWAYFRNG